MDEQALTDCCRALGLPADDVLALRDGADLLPALLARLILEQRSARPNSAGTAWCGAVLAGWGERPFTAAELIAWAERCVSDLHRAVLAASRDLCRLKVDADLTSHRLGIALGDLCERPQPGALRVVEADKRRGVKVWAVRGSWD